MLNPDARSASVWSQVTTGNQITWLGTPGAVGPMIHAGGAHSDDIDHHVTGS